MPQIIVMLIFLLLSGYAGAMDLAVADMEDMDGEGVAVYLKEHELESSPPWNPGENAIPVSVDEAVDAVSKWVKLRHPHNSGVMVSELVLKRIRGGGNQLYWHYLVRYREVLEDGSEAPKDSIAAVLLDGKVFPVIALPPL